MGQHGWNVYFTGNLSLSNCIPVEQTVGVSLYLMTFSASNESKIHFKRTNETRIASMILNIRFQFAYILDSKLERDWHYDCENVNLRNYIYLVLLLLRHF